MKAYCVIETADVSLVGLQPFGDVDRARAIFEEICAEHRIVPTTDTSNELQGTLAIAGDTAYRVRLLERRVLI